MTKAEQARLGELAVKDPATRVGRAAHGGTHLPLFRHLAKDLLQMEAAPGDPR